MSHVMPCHAMPCLTEKLRKINVRQEESELRCMHFGLKYIYMFSHKMFVILILHLILSNFESWYQNSNRPVGHTKELC